MRHKKGNKKLSKPTDQRMALIRSQVGSLFLHKRIKTTIVRAKEVRKQAEKMITWAKQGDLASKRMIISFLQNKELSRSVWSDVARYAKRSGGYTRIIPLGPRSGDAAPMVMLELVDVSA